MAFNGQKTGLNITQDGSQQPRIIWSKMSVVLRLRNPAYQFSIKLQVTTNQDKLPQVQRLQTTQMQIRSTTQTKIKLLAALYSFLEGLREGLFTCLFQLLDQRTPTSHYCISCFISDSWITSSTSKASKASPVPPTRFSLPLSRTLVITLGPTGDHRLTTLQYCQLTSNLISSANHFSFARYCNRFTGSGDQDVDVFGGHYSACLLLLHSKQHGPHGSHKHDGEWIT